MRRVVLNSLMITVLVILVIAVGLSYGKDHIVKAYLERIIKGTVGLRFSMDECAASIFNTDVRIKDVVILNPKDFKDKVMVDVTEAYADFEAVSLLKRKPRLKDLRINIDEICIIKNKEGTFNLDALAVVKASKEAKRVRDISEVPVPVIGIESFDLKIKTVIYKDYSQPIGPIIIEKDVNISQRFENIEDPAFIVRIILVEAIKKAAIEQSLNISVLALSRPIGKILDTARQIGKGAVGVVQQTGKQVTAAVTIPLGKKEKQGKPNKAGNPVGAQPTGAKAATEAGEANDAAKR